MLADHRRGKSNLPPSQLHKVAAKSGNNPRSQALCSVHETAVPQQKGVIAGLLESQNIVHGCPPHEKTGGLIRFR
jgi:hypothetical protein